MVTLQLLVRRFSGVYRKLKVWHLCLLSVVFCWILIQYNNLYVKLGQSYSTDNTRRKLQESFPSKLLQAGMDYGGMKSSVLTLYDPFTRDFTDSIGLKGYQGYDCVSAMEGFDPPKQSPSKVYTGSRLTEKDIMNLTSDCEAFRKQYGYERYRMVSSEELEFPLAFNMLLYNDVDQLHFLLRAIYRPHNTYCLHVDGYASPDVFLATQSLAGCLDNVFLASTRENVTYSGFTRLQADINCMKDHLYRSSFTHRRSFPFKTPKSDWKYLINLPSQNFPLKTNMELIKILKIYNGANDIEGITGERKIESRYIYKHVYEPSGGTGRLKIVKTNEKNAPPPHNITVVKGSAYGVFSRNFVRYVLEDTRAKAFLNWTRSVNSPDEYFWATLNHNPHLKVPGAHNGKPDEKPWLAVYASWPPRDPCHSGKVVRGVCIFGVKDLPQLAARKEFFANKFYMNFEPQTLHCLDQWYFNKSRAALPLDTYYYRKLPFIRK